MITPRVGIRVRELRVRVGRRAGTVSSPILEVRVLGRASASTARCMRGSFQMQVGVGIRVGVPVGVRAAAECGVRVRVRVRDVGFLPEAR